MSGFTSYKMLKKYLEMRKHYDTVMITEVIQDLGQVEANRRLRGIPSEDR